jgi:hypothetical protein
MQTSPTQPTWVNQVESVSFCTLALLASQPLGAQKAPPTGTERLECFASQERGHERIRDCYRGQPPLAREPTTCAHLDSHAPRMSLCLVEGSIVRSGRAAAREPASFSHDACTLSTCFPCPQCAWVHVCFGKKTASKETTRYRVHASADVPILWADYPARQKVLPGVRKVSQTSIEVNAEGKPRCHSVEIAIRSILPR